MDPGSHHLALLGAAHAFWVAVIAGGRGGHDLRLHHRRAVLRLGDDYLHRHPGFAEIIRVVIVNATSITNGSLGIKGIPARRPADLLYLDSSSRFVVLSTAHIQQFRQRIALHTR